MNHWRTFLPFGIFLTCFLIYLPFDLPTVGNASDNYWYVPSSISLLHEGNLELSEYNELIQDRSSYGIVRYRGLPYNLFPFGTSLITLPLVVLGEFLFHNTDQITHFFAIAAFTAKVLAALSAAFLFVTVLRLTDSLPLSLFLSIVFAFATSHFSLHAGGLWSHNTSLLLITMALCILVGPEQHLYLAAAPLAFAFIARPTVAVHIVFITIYVFLFHRRHFFRFACVGGLIGLLFMLFSYHVFGRLIPPYYGAGRLDFRHFGEALAGNLVSPNRGLFVFTPLFLGSVYGMYWSFKTKTVDARFYRLLSLMAVFHWVLISTFRHWWAGATIGPRFFGDNLSVLTLLLIPAVNQVRQRRLLYPVAAFALLWSLWVQIHAVTSSQVYRWNFTPVKLGVDPSRIWDWKDMQILRTALPESAIKNLPYSFKIFQDGRVIAKVMKSDIPEIADSKVRVDHKKFKAISLKDLLAKYHVQALEVTISGGGIKTSLNWDEAMDDLYIYFAAGRVAKIHCNCEKEFPPFVESITVGKM